MKILKWLVLTSILVLKLLGSLGASPQTPWVGFAEICMGYSNPKLREADLGGLGAGPQKTYTIRGNIEWLFCGRQYMYIVCMRIYAIESTTRGRGCMQLIYNWRLTCLRSGIIIQL
jgi:hypothetical protein